MYIHKVQYYETDKMAITHHSNYIRFMEEARNEFLKSIGFNYKEMESGGLYSPVLSVSINYKKSTTFEDEIEIEVRLVELAAVRSRYTYVMRCRGEVVCTGESSHCIIDKTGRPVVLRKVRPDLFAILDKNVTKEKE